MLFLFATAAAVLLSGPLEGETLRGKFGVAGAGQIPVDLTAWPLSFDSPVTMRAVPGGREFVVLEKAGRAFLTDGKTKKIFLQIQVETRSEMGLLGVAFHPRFAKNKKFYLNYNPRGGKYLTRIEEWYWPEGGRARAKQLVLEIPQPFANHNGGDLQFGPDGMLYIGVGDGGSGGDPENHGQNLKTLLGTMLRIDVDRRTGGKPYAIPKDNPWRQSQRPEIFAYGLRNPWRFGFDPGGRLIVGDVGQNAWEELSFVAAGDNLGWRVMEGKHCYLEKKCKKPAQYRPPFFEYGRDVGSSITAGYVYTARDGSRLQGKYIFGDFVSGRLLAVDLPAKGQNSPKQLYDLGRFALSPVSFARGRDGEFFVVGFQKGRIYRLRGR